MATMTLAEARDNLEQLLADAGSGEEVIIVDDDGQRFRLVPSATAPAKKRGLVGSARGKVRMADDFDESPEGFDAYLA